MQDKRRVTGTGTYLQSFVRCPFYRRDDGKRRIVCEGIIDDSSIYLTFRYDNLFKRQIRTFCCEHYKNCEIYQMLQEKYQDE